MALNTFRVERDDGVTGRSDSAARLIVDAPSTVAPSARDPLRELAVGGDDDERRRIGVAPRPPRRCGRRRRCGPARRAYATSTPSCTPSGRPSSGRPSSTTAMRSPVRRASACSSLDEPAARAVSIAPPAVGPAADHVVAVDDDSPARLGRDRGDVRRPAHASTTPPRARRRRRATSAPSTVETGSRARRARGAAPRPRRRARAASSPYQAGSRTCAHLSAPMTTTS